MSIARKDLKDQDFKGITSGRKLAPVHPGTVLLADFIGPMGLTRYRVAKAIGVQQRRIDEINSAIKPLEAAVTARADELVAGGMAPIKLEKKPITYEVIWAETAAYVGKLLVIEAGQRLSLQYHEVKDESILVQEGTLRLHLEDDTGAIAVEDLGVGNGSDVPTGLVADGPRAPGVAWSSDRGVIGASAVGPSYRVYRWEVDYVESHRFRIINPVKAIAKLRSGIRLSLGRTRAV
jgi:hypothetical protein